MPTAPRGPPIGRAAPHLPLRCIVTPRQLSRGSGPLVAAGREGERERERVTVVRVRHEEGIDGGFHDVVSQ